MRSATEAALQPYATPLEWLEGKRRFVRVLRQLCGYGPDGRRLLREAVARPDPEVLAAAMDWHEEEHRRRVELTREAGIILPIDKFAAEHKLDDVEREAVEILLVVATDLAWDDSRRELQTTELVRLLARGREDRFQDYLPYFLPGSRLRKAGLTREVPYWEPFGAKRLGLDEDVVSRLLGEERGRAESRGGLSTAGKLCDGDIGEFLVSSGVVLGEAVLESIRTVWGYVRRYAVIREKWGFGSLSHAPVGVRLLFHGPPGTGKTLTARCLCRALGRESLVVSYPDLVSKWVGDTEKNTRDSFAEAARDGKVLVFDEADAVFARRTEVRNSTDRFANGEVNTLLMELERFSDIAILTTNHTCVLDPALERRIQHKVHFGPPDAKARTEIWRKHLPQEAPLGSDVDFARLAREFELTGGQIANAAMTAASLAASRLKADSDTGQITMADFEAAAQRELKGYSESDRSGRLGF